MNNKILVELIVPTLEKKYDLFIPLNKRVGTVKTLLEENLVELTDNLYEISENTNLYSKETGEIFSLDVFVKDSGMQNGSRIILV